MPLFKPEKMVRVEIDFPRRYIYEVTKTIAELGYFQPENISGIDIRKDPLEDIDLVEIGTKIAGLKADLTASMCEDGNIRTPDNSCRKTRAVIGNTHM